MPASIGAQVHDELVHHRIALSRYSNGLVRKVVAQLNRVEETALSRLAQASGSEVRGVRLNQLLGEVRSIQAAGWTLIRGGLDTEIDALVGVESAFAQRVTVAAAGAVDITFSGAPQLAQVIGAVRARPFQGRLLKEWLSEAEEGAAKRVRETIRQGFIDGSTTDQIVRQLRGTARNQYRDGIIEGSRRGVQAMVRTAITHTSTVAHEETWAANADVILGLIWTSTLDGRTSPVCRHRSEKVYPLGKGPRPPAHIACRSCMRPQVREIPGVVPFKPPSYQEWLKGQPAAVQDDILGPSRGRLFRTGGYTVDRFVDRAGRELTLEELRRRDAGAFSKAA